MGSQGNETLDGLAGNDQLVGRAGNDLLLGGEGNDRLANAFLEDGLYFPETGKFMFGFIGDADVDTMQGGAGHDTYFVGPNDLLSDSSGIDTVVLPDAWEPFPVTSWTLGSEFENLEMYNSSFNEELNGPRPEPAGASGIGNGLDNRIWGSMGADFISSMGGNDTVAAGAGNDAADGGVGNDTLDGGFGSDTLTGGAGPDSFLYTEAPGDGNADSITDFEPGSDNLQLDDAVHVGIGAPGNFSTTDSRFWAAEGATSGHDGDDRVIYNTSTGDLYYDSDGDGLGGSQPIATLSGAPDLGAGDILVI
jgi:Ca2+-binding RTX toxin-like protein